MMDRSRNPHGNVLIPFIQSRWRVLARAPWPLAETILGHRSVSSAKRQTSAARKSTWPFRLANTPA